MRTLLALCVLAAPAIAHADRSTVVDVGVTVGAAGNPNSADSSADGLSLVGPRATLSWENPLVGVPDRPGYRFAGALVPQIIVGSYLQSDRADGYLGVGLRADLQMGQRDQGLLKVSARGAIYAVGRALVIGDKREPMYEVGFGEYLSRFHTSTRVGFELTVVVLPDASAAGDPDANVGGFVGLYVGS
jgi:hypothetical protein